MRSVRSSATGRTSDVARIPTRFPHVVGTSPTSPAGDSGWTSSRGYRAATSTGNCRCQPSSTPPCRRRSVTSQRARRRSSVSWWTADRLRSPDAWPARPRPRPPRGPAAGTEPWTRRCAWRPAPAGPGRPRRPVATSSSGSTCGGSQNLGVVDGDHIHRQAHLDGVAGDPGQISSAGSSGSCATGIGRCRSKASRPGRP